MSYGTRGDDDQDSGQRQSRRRRAAEADESYDHIPEQSGPASSYGSGQYGQVSDYGSGQYAQAGGYGPGQHGHVGDYGPGPHGPADDYDSIDDRGWALDQGWATGPRQRNERDAPPGGTPFGQPVTDPYAPSHASGASATRAFGSAPSAPASYSAYGWEEPARQPEHEAYPAFPATPYGSPPHGSPAADPYEPAVTREPGRRSSKRAPKSSSKRTSKGWLGALAGVLAVLLLLGFGVGAYFLIDDSVREGSTAALESPTPSAAAPAPAASDKRDISSQAVDPEPLTESEVFPAATVTVEGRAYAVQKTQLLTDCKLATTGELGSGYVKLGCNQLVRATVFSPQKNFIATIGVFNFTDQAAAATAKADTKTVLNTGKGAIAGWSVGGGTEMITMSETYLSWLPVGHYLVYCVLARADGKKPDPNDPAVQQVLADTVENYLKAQIKERAAA